MKTSSDPRHLERLKKVQNMFAYSYQPSAPADNIETIISSLPDIDQKISTAAPEWPLDKINKVDLAILRVSTFEILHDDTVPEKVSIDEAVEIAKELGAEASPSFVNGVLGSILKNTKSKNAK